MPTEPTKKWTSGPWETGAMPDRYPTSVWSGEKFVCATDGMTGPIPESDAEAEANAHLIAQAPSMYEMLSSLEIVSHEDEIKIAAILAAARGETP